MLPTLAPHELARRILMICGLILGSMPCLQALEVESFTEPYRDIDVAALEMGIIEAIDVKEGARVKEGQLLARLDDAELEATLRIAKSAMESRGRLESAIEELKLQTEMVSKLEQLKKRNHASQQEIERAQTQQRIAQARLKAVREEHDVKTLEYRRALVRLERRRLAAPIGGIVTRIFKDCGESVSPGDPVILKVVQIDPLLVVFSVPAERGQELVVGKTVEVRIGATNTPIDGQVEFVSPTADPQSGTTRVRVRIPNPGEQLPSGVACRLILPEDWTPITGDTGR